MRQESPARPKIVVSPTTSFAGAAMPRTGSASPGSDTLADQLGRAMAAVAVGSDDLEQLAADAHRADGNHEVDPEYLQRNGLLGGGGYASVWLTTDTRTGRQRR
eukprot:scaffold126384_cov63-Phaeocystis_antarctica.AAC.2